ncbi:unnamed protein product [Euphydryas editha]|uniref:Uncharacterized protein n=1 Tax=Euphydryas editha TaxID=104508 RepID=A0AAU9TRV4_EUPED|nr:unnamed protein product [Euphydryas editha]
MTSSVLLASELNTKHPHWNSRVSDRHRIQLDLTSFSRLLPYLPHNFPIGRMTSADVLDVAILKGVTLKLRYIEETIPELDLDYRPVLIELGPDTQLSFPTRVVTNWKKLDELLQSIDSHTLSDIGTYLPDRIDIIEVNQ